MFLQTVQAQNITYSSFKTLLDLCKFD